MTAVITIVTILVTSVLFRGMLGRLSILVGVLVGYGAAWVQGQIDFTTVGQADCARFVADHGLAVDDLFTERWSLDQAVEAYKLFDGQTSGKAVFDI